MKTSPKPWIVPLLILGLCWIGAFAVSADELTPAADRAIAEIDISSGLITWQPLLDEAMALRVSGGGTSIDREFAAGETPYLKISQDDNGLLHDGSYTWSLVALPEQLPAVAGDLPSGRKWEPQAEKMLQSLQQSGYFTVAKSAFVSPLQLEPTTDGEPVQQVPNANKDQVIADDLIVTRSLCVGFDCVDGEVFGTDTIRLKENVLRIKFEDTSGQPFPTNDWQLTANDQSSGGAEKFSIDDITNGRTPFTVEARAPSHSLYVDDGGRVGIGTSTPVAELHAVDGETPTLRLEQNGSSGFAPQTWDVAGNETNFFIRDTTHSSRLPFRIRPGASTNSIYIDAEGDIGMSTSAPDASLHVRRTDGSASLHIEETTNAAATYTLMHLETSGADGSNIRPRFTMTHGGQNAAWNFDVLNDGNFAFIRNGGSVFTFTSGGDLQIAGDFVSSGTTLNVPDFVFADDYNLMPLDEVKAFIDQESHLPQVPSAEEINRGALNLTDMQLTLLQKVEELTLYTLDQHEEIQSQKTTIDTQQQLIQDLMQRLEALESKTP